MTRQGRRRRRSAFFPVFSRRTGKPQPALGAGAAEWQPLGRHEPDTPVAGMKSADVLDLITTLPLMAAERPQGDLGRPFALSSEFQPAGDQPQAIAELCEGIARNERDQVLLGVTGSGKTFTMAHVIARSGRPAIILAPNKTLAAQLYGEMRSFFPENAVEYFVSYYDYYQPEAYVPRTDTYVEKESSLNEEIDRMRHSATRAILERRDV